MPIKSKGYGQQGQVAWHVLNSIFDPGLD